MPYVVIQFQLIKYTLLDIFFGLTTVFSSPNRTHDCKKCFQSLSLSIYADTNGLQINIDKTKAMIFNKTGRFIREKFYMRGEQFVSTNSYKYLGLVFTPSGEIHTSFLDLKDSVQRVIPN